MKLGNNGYITSILILLIIIPIIILLITVMIQYTDNIDKTTNNIESDQLKTITNDYKGQIESLTELTLTEVTSKVIQTKTPLVDSRKTIKEVLQQKIDLVSEKYKKNSFQTQCIINNVKQTSDPFIIEVDYTLNVQRVNNPEIKITTNNKVDASLVNPEHPVYDPLPTLKTGVTENNTLNKINYTNKLEQFLQNTNNSKLYENSISGCIIKKCPYENYAEHGHDKKIIQNCLDNHYYHESHDGLCLFCRLESKDTCDHMGLETFIIPTIIANNTTVTAPVSIDHVLLNGTNSSHYQGNSININNTIVLYLDDGHKSKYGL